ncbi:MAG: metallophosphoesterase family protein [Tannerellaceae bacterium]
MGLNPPNDKPQGAIDYSQYFDSLASFGQKYGFQTVVPRRDFDIVLSKVTSATVTATVLCYCDCVGYITYGANLSERKDFKAGEAQQIEIDNLSENESYSYRFYYKKADSDVFASSDEFSFKTKKNTDTSFSFAVIADSHLDENSDTAIYLSTLSNIAKGNNDFIVDLGDTFMTDKYGQQTFSYAYGQYFAQRYYLGSVCHSLPYYFVQGNHDGETGDKRAEMSAWSKLVREELYPNPVPENYFTWEWGDVQIIVLDPYTFTSSQGNRDPWQRSLGDSQYRWLEQVLKGSTQKYKFVFIHNLVGGVDKEGQGRGGAEAAIYWEWGGKNLEGLDEFSQKRSWAEPIHALLKRYGVQIVFHGHDHLYAKQDYDGIIYQCVQQPGLKRYDKLTYATTYGYINGTIKYDPGYIRISVSPDCAKIEYLSHTGNLLDSYTL